MANTMEKRVTTRGTRKTAIAIADCSHQTNEDFTLRIDNKPLSVMDNFMVSKIREAIAVIGTENLKNLNIKVRTTGGGNISKVTAIKLAICKAVVSFYGKFYNEAKKQEIKSKLLQFDKYTLVADTRRVEAKKVGGPSARAKYTKSYR